MKNLKTLISIIIVLFITQNLFSQNWEQYFIPPNSVTPSSLEVYVDKTINDDYVLITSLYNSSKDIMRIDSNGIFNWVSSSVGFLPTDIQNLIATNDNHYVSCVDNFGGAALFFTKIDTTGTGVSVYPHSNVPPFQLTLFDIIETQDGNLVVLLSEQNAAVINIRLIKINFISGEIWSTYPNLNGSAFTSNDNLNLGGLIELSNGNLAFAGGYNNLTSGLSDLFIIKTNSIGNKIDDASYNISNPINQTYLNLSVSANGEFALTASENTQVNPLLLKTDTQLNELWRTTLWANGSAKDVVFDANNIVVVGEKNNHGTITKYNNNGTHIWTRQHISAVSSLYSASNYSHLEILNGGDYMIFGGVNSTIFEVYVTRVDSSGVLFSSALEGNVYKDDDFNCTFNSNENTLPTQVLLQMVQGTDTSFHFTDNNGFYHIPANVGTYELSTVPLGTYWTNCTPQLVNLTANDTLLTDLGLQPLTTCPDLQVNIAVAALVRCFSNIYHVTYANLGTQNETGVYIEIDMDSFLIVNSASIPYTQNGTIYTFNIGNLDIGQIGDFTIDVTVDCTAQLGQPHCVNAMIFPNQICLTNTTTWNGATIVTNAYCSPNDSVTFELINIGLGNMTQSRNYWVIEDQVLQNQGTYQLLAGQNTTITVPANGYTYQIQADQEITFPLGNNLPSAVTFGCSSDPTITVNNLINQFSLDDYLNFVDVDCQQNVASYDPNDKTGFPNGYGNQHFITKNDKIEYLIRFQNTGTYTAFNVVIEDTIDMTTLDLRTLQIQGSSHDYELEIKDGNILVFNFNNIMLPDSNTNEPASHGFIRFKIGQKANNAIGTVIENSAAIYFDFNAPVITNTTFHTVGENFIQVVSTKPIQEKLATVKVFPNPFSEQATFEIETDERYQNLTLTIYNVMGQAIKTAQSNGDNRIILDSNGLTSGVYFYQIRSEGLVLDSGKLMVR